MCLPTARRTLTATSHRSMSRAASVSSPSNRRRTQLAGAWLTRCFVHALCASCHAQGGGRGPPEPMLPATRHLLEEFYQPFNTELATLLGEPTVAEWRAVRWTDEVWHREVTAGAGRARHRRRLRLRSHSAPS
jgi:hypothetical protein